MKRLVSYCLVMIAILAVAAFVLTRRDTLVQRSKASVDSAREDQQLIEDIHVRSAVAQLNKREGAFFDFAITSIDGGGVELIALREPTGHFDIVWQGQDAPPCEIIQLNHVPTSIAPYCLKTITIDRTNELESFLEPFFH
jgi:DNA/RNA endonuclease YhcR with UshA esterase domain